MSIKKLFFLILGCVCLILGGSMGLSYDLFHFWRKDFKNTAKIT